MTPTIDQLEPPTKEQWQQMRQDYEDWLKEYSSAPAPKRKCEGPCFCTGACQGYVSPGTAITADKKPGV